MTLQHKISLKPYNTFGIDETAMYYTEAASIDDLREISQLPYQKHVLGGGSNILLTHAVDGLVVRSCMKGINVVKEDGDYVWLQAQSGEVWHELVMYAVSKGWGGIENLALIPGCVGAAPIQNIGAYGVEVKDTIESVMCWHWKEQKIKSYDNAFCKFGYRDSIFKHELKNDIFVIAVLFKLHKKPTLNTQYGAIKDGLNKMNIQNITVSAVAEAVMNIRNSKLPNPKDIGNAGSFFKNPVVPVSRMEQLSVQYPSLPFYQVDENSVKIPAGWLIEKCGWKAFREGDIGVYEKQALVLVNYGNATGADIWRLSEQVIASVHTKFDITMEREVEAWG